MRRRISETVRDSYRVTMVRCSIVPKSYVLYQTTWSAMILANLSRSFHLSYKIYKYILHNRV